MLLHPEQLFFAKSVDNLHFVRYATKPWNAQLRLHPPELDTLTQFADDHYMRSRKEPLHHPRSYNMFSQQLDRLVLVIHTQGNDLYASYSRIKHRFQRDHDHSRYIHMRQLSRLGQPTSPEWGLQYCSTSLPSSLSLETGISMEGYLAVRLQQVA